MGSTAMAQAVTRVSQRRTGFYPVRLVVGQVSARTLGFSPLSVVSPIKLITETVQL